MSQATARQLALAIQAALPAGLVDVGDEVDDVPVVGGATFRVNHRGAWYDVVVHEAPDQD